MYLLAMNPILTIAAIIPAIVLIRDVYKLDRLDKEPRKLLTSLVILGVVSTSLAIATESVGGALVGAIFDEHSLAYRLLEYVIVVGLSEEGFKYLLLKFATWKNPNFNCTFDGVVYAVCVSLGFALWENIGYVGMYGLSTALVRAVTAVPGHACFGVFMGIFYGLAKKYQNLGVPSQAEHYRKLAVIVPVIIHGAYDFIATMESSLGGLIFIPFIVVMFIIARSLMKDAAKNDTYISNDIEYTDNNDGNFNNPNQGF